jgi:hypothetical protein
MEQNPIQNDARTAERKRKLGHELRCLLCPEGDIWALTRVHRSLLEKHHLVGKANDPDALVTLCFNCHHKLTERMRANGTSMAPPETCLELIENLLLGLAAFFQMLSEKHTEWARKPAALATALDAAYPQWRSMPEAQ